MDLDFLYKYSYDHGSLFIHPRSTEGAWELLKLYGINSDQDFPNNIVILHDCFFTLGLLMNESLISSTGKWNKLLFDCIAAIMDYLDGQKDLSEELLEKIIHIKMKDEILYQP